MYKEIGLLHRDISMGNLAFYKSGDMSIVVLLDFDLATLAGSTENASQRRTGTAPFMARDVLVAVSPDVMYIHHLRHDLESIFFIIILYGLGYTAAGLQKGKTDWLLEWRIGSYEKIRDAKQSFIVDLKPGLLEHIESDFLRGFARGLHKEYRKRAKALEAAQEKCNDERSTRIEARAKKARSTHSMRVGRD